ncbi:helix-turn-helix transcriptional regulator [Haloplanus natans]|uniref:helix-turn-helix transcriptional regulator n=1 Tax=Haloplanus natans TaxID=376171 RepID=UPI000677B5B4|nr:helix-turn-helix domain-containing protein [Haloplanus natans]
MTDLSPVAAVERRIDVLRALDGAPDSKVGVAERVDISRSTAERAMHELATHGFVASSSDGYRVTIPGRLALDAHGQRAARIDAAAAVAPLFDGVSLSFDLDPAVLDGVRVVEAQPHAPTRPVECVSTLVADATHVSAYTGRFLSRHARLYHDRILDGMTGCFLTTERIIERQRTTRPGELQEVIDLGHVSLRRLDRDDPVTLVLAETPDGPEMGLVVYRDESPRGFLGTDDPAATRWARALYERLWTAATPV